MTLPLAPDESFRAYAILVTCYIQANRTPTTKLEEHNILHCHQRRLEPWVRVTCTENFVKFGHIIFETCQQADRHTDRHTHCNTSQTYLGQSKNGNLNYWKKILTNILRCLAQTRPSPPLFPGPHTTNTDLFAFDKLSFGYA